MSTSKNIKMESKLKHKMKKVFGIIIIVFYNTLLVNGQLTTGQKFSNYVLPSSCRKTASSNSLAEFFDAVKLECAQCRGNQRQSTDGLSCECLDGYKYTKNFGGRQVECSKCDQAVSEDGWDCVQCPNGTSNSTGSCDKCPSDQIAVHRNVDGVLLSPLQCTSCVSQTQANTDNNRCEICKGTLGLGKTDCACADPAVEVAGVCFNAEDFAENVDTQIPIESGEANSGFYMTDEDLQLAYGMCKNNNATSCQVLANMCALVYYQINGNNNGPCQLLNSLTDENYVPAILFPIPGDLQIITNDLTTAYTVDPVITIPFMVASYSAYGQFEGYSEITGGKIQLCTASENTLNAAFVFGTYYSHSCSISAKSLYNQVKFPFRFYEIYLTYTNNGPQILKIPILVTNYESNGQRINEGEMRTWQLSRRFFLVDSVSTKPNALEDALYIRYAKSIKLFITLQDDTADGLIYIPYFSITYADISKEQADNGDKVDISFSVDYTMSLSNYYRSFQISVGTLSSLSVLFAGYRSYVWSRRAGRLTIDFPTLVNFLFYLFGALANCFFIVTFGIASYFFIFYKRQNLVFLVHMDGERLVEWEALFITAFVFKAFSLAHMIVMQCSADIFLIDWERPKGKSSLETGDATSKQPNTVSIWRTYFVANEWNEIQTTRKINKTFQIFAVIFFLVVVGFEDTSTKDPDGSVNKDSDVYRSEQSQMFRMALASTIYLVVGFVQTIFFVFIYERFITDGIREFVDLCSMSNVSVFVMAHSNYGYYIHGRSVHGRADVDLRQMNDMISREEQDLVGQRGLVPNTEPQTFIMSIPKRLRQKYEDVYLPVQLENATAATRAEQNKSVANEKNIKAYNTLNKVLCAFIDHSLEGIDYVVKEKSILEKILDTEFLELTEKGIFYNDSGHSFDNSLLYGNELMLIVFDTLFFCIIDFIATDFVLAGILTYIQSEIVCLVRELVGKKNLAKKTLVDERFLI